MLASAFRLRFPFAGNASRSWAFSGFFNGFLGPCLSFLGLPSHILNLLQERVWIVNRVTHWEMQPMTGGVGILTFLGARLPCPVRADVGLITQVQQLAT